MVLGFASVKDTDVSISMVLAAEVTCGLPILLKIMKFLADVTVSDFLKANNRRDGRRPPGQ